MKPQDLLFIQLFQVATLAWLRKHQLPSMHLVSTVENTSGSMDIKFGFPFVQETQHAALLHDWTLYSKRVERLHLLMQFLSEGKKLGLPSSCMDLWQKEGELLTSELFSQSADTYRTPEEAIQALEDSFQSQRG